MVVALGRYIFAISAMYRPNGSYLEFHTAFKETLSDLTNAYNNVFCVGDLNMDLLRGIVIVIVQPCWM